MSKINYYVIGGQYAQYCYGGAETLHGAKCIAAKHDEYWDNRQGWHRPSICAADDCHMADTQFFGQQIIRAQDAQPVAAYDYDRGRWISPVEDA